MTAIQKLSEEVAKVYRGNIERELEKFVAKYPDIPISSMVLREIVLTDEIPSMFQKRYQIYVEDRPDITHGFIIKINTEWKE